MVYLTGGCAYACRSKGGCGRVWAKFGHIYGQGLAKVEGSEWIRLIRQGWVIYTQ